MKNYLNYTVILFVVILLLLPVNPAFAGDDQWSGTHLLSPVSAKHMVMEAIDSGTSEGTLVSIGIPTDAANHKWVFVSKGSDLYSIHPSYSSTLALSIAKGSKENGSQLLLLTYKGLDSQLWSIKKNSNSTLSIIPKHAPNKGIDDFYGNRKPGAKLDIWDWTDKDMHLQWNIVNSVNDMPASVPEGKVVEGTFNQSKIFSGTVHQYWVYVPKQYDPSKPACVYVQQDGYRGFESEVFDELIARNEMPVTVGVFVNPGYLPPPAGKETSGRPNRNFEYDSLGDNYVRFIVDELLPAIAKKENLNLTTSGNDRCIAGASSGGICAFNAAWERTDAFSRVYANSGSFVAFRGGNEFPTLIRKYEAKPIRSFLTTGTTDMENCAGDWTLLDMEMDKSLKFSDYDYKFKVIEGGHGAGYDYDGLVEAMRYLWKGWPEPVKAGVGAPRSQDILIPGEQWQLLAGVYKDARGAACNSKGEIFFADVLNNHIYRIDSDGKVSQFIRDAAHANSITIGTNDELMTVSAATGKILSYDTSGKSTVYAEGIHGQYITANPGGGVYVTSAGKPGEKSTLWFIKDGHKTAVDSVAKFATGLAITPDQWLLAMADGNSKWVYSYQINNDGTLANRERFFWLYVADCKDNAGTEALCYDKEGHLYAATDLGIQICVEYGPTQVILPVPGGKVNGICFGGPDMDTLFAFCGDKIYKRKVKTHALGAFTPFTKMTPGQL